MVNFGHGGGQVLMGGEMDLEGLDGGGSPPHPPPYWLTLPGNSTSTRNKGAFKYYISTLGGGGG